MACSCLREVDGIAQSEFNQGFDLFNLFYWFNWFNWLDWLRMGMEEQRFA